MVTWYNNIVFQLTSIFFISSEVGLPICCVNAFSAFVAKQLCTHYLLGIIKLEPLCEQPYNGEENAETRTIIFSTIPLRDVQ